jgi:hypothetical protein
MIALEELVAAFVAAEGRRFLVSGRPPVADAAQEILGVNLDPADAAPARIPVTFGREASPFRQWLRGLRTAGARDLLLVPPPPDSAARLALAASGGAADCVVRPEMRLAPRSLVTLADFDRLLQSNGGNVALQRTVLHEFHVVLRAGHAPEDWAQWCASVGADDEEDALHAVSVALARPEHASVRDTWFDLMASRPNPDQGWRITFRAVPGGAPPKPPAGDDGASPLALGRALTELAGFAHDTGLVGFAQHFRASAALLEPTAAVVDGDVYSELFRDTLPASAIRVLRAVDHAASAFGGMGSWNDVAGQDSPGYAAATGEVARRLRPTYAGAINTALH